MSGCFQRSRAIILAIPVLLFVVLVFTGPVTAATIDISVSGDIPDMVLTPGITSQNASVYLYVTSDTATWTVSVKDASDDSKPPSYAGRMVEWDGTSAYVASPGSPGSQYDGNGCNSRGFQRILGDVKF